MFQKYDNPQIYKKIKIAKILTIISVVLSIVTVLVYVLNYEILDFPFGAEEYGGESKLYAKIMFYISPLWSISCLSCISSYSRFTPKKQSKESNDCTVPNNFLAVVLAPAFIIALAWLFDAIMFLSGRQSSYLDLYDLSVHAGYLLPSYIFLCISAGVLKSVSKLIKEEWEKFPPVFYVQEKIGEKQKETLQKTEHNTKQYQPLIEKCGIRFFIKYYRQIVRLPLRDVTVTENYSSQEREERLSAAKKIIDRGLSETALVDILKRYGDILDVAEVEEAKKLLTEIQQTSSQSS